MTKATLTDWQAAAAKEVKGKDPMWQIPDCFSIKQSCNSEDVGTKD